MGQGKITYGMPYTEAKLQLDNESIPLSLKTGSDGSQVLDVSRIRSKTGLNTYDPRLNNTATAESSISWIDNEKGTLLYRGYDVADLVDNCSFVETSHLLWHGELPTETELKEFEVILAKHSMIHESMRNFFHSFPGNAHPLAILSVMVTALSSYYPNTYEENIEKGIDIKARLLTKVRTLAAWAFKKSIGHPVIYPRDNLSYCGNFLNMMFAVPAEDYKISDEHDSILNKLLILYSDHEQNVATSTVRLVGSTQANLFACMNAGMCALWGARESGANVPPIRMLNEMLEGQQEPEQYFEKFIKGQETSHYQGLGHRSYAGKDPRAVIAGKIFHEFLKNHPKKDRPVLRKALEVEEFVNGHPHFKELNLYPNLDFYSGLSMYLMNIPPRMSNVVRVMGKMSGWLAHWQEQRDQVEKLSIRPRQLYNGQSPREYKPMSSRS